MKYILILSTVNSNQNAEKIAETLVKGKLAACVNIIPNLKSIYSWKNEIEKDEEILLLIKTRENLFEAVKNKILEIHDYEIPEIIVIPIVSGYDKYFNWIENVTT